LLAAFQWVFMIKSHILRIESCPVSLRFRAPLPAECSDRAIEKH
jgi:hypothetical protein